MTYIKVHDCNFDSYNYNILLKAIFGISENFNTQTLTGLHLQSHVNNYMCFVAVIFNLVVEQNSRKGAL